MFRVMGPTPNRAIKKSYIYNHKLQWMSWEITIIQNGGSIAKYIVTFSLRRICVLSCACTAIVLFGMERIILSGSDFYHRFYLFRRNSITLNHLSLPIAIPRQNIPVKIFRSKIPDKISGVPSGTDVSPPVATMISTYHEVVNIPI